jgi:hypothetical protein
MRAFLAASSGSAIRETAISNCQHRKAWYIFGCLKDFDERQHDGTEDRGDGSL